MNRIISIVSAAVLLLLLAATMAPAQSRAITDLTAEELQQLRAQTADVLVIDVRTAREFYDGHIAGAINISSQASNQFRSLSLLLPKDKETPLVFYCRGYS
ncbi:rhodanese-like domain-containing protein [Pelovirga terrestris]|uniref:Rhodanese-like domain-containing protein n=1 Tax=Pelovirga terrestris TaxID=2771352 RepID=A0A8J6UQ87_9BACT|nr:rhodanese-like domain-containing protein [Pelovirga terrestris]MBD1401774.1 rhodanese-like domain-containing protein [Pelovirga terrestris]